MEINLIYINNVMILNSLIKNLKKLVLTEAKYFLTFYMLLIEYTLFLFHFLIVKLR